MDDDQQFCLRWNNHQSTLISVFDTLLENGTLVDCTLAAEGKFLKAHKVVLSACSPYFATLLAQQYDKHPIFILKDVKFQELRAMMDYMYRGEVNISQDQLAALLKAAESLQIKGLSDNRGATQQQPPSAPSAATKQQGSNKAGAGLTIEHKRTAGDASQQSREGSSSPSGRKRKKVRRRTVEQSGAGDAADSASAISATNQQAASAGSSSSNTSSAAAATGSAAAASVATGAAAAAAAASAQPQITSANTSNTIATASSAATNTASSSSAAAAVTGAVSSSPAVAMNVTKKTEAVDSKAKLQQQQQHDDDEDDDDDDEDDEDMDQDHMEPRAQRAKHHHHQQHQDNSAAADDMLLEPKSEYDNDETVEDLTLDDEELLEDLDQAGPSHGGEGSSQGYAQWQVDRQDEVFMGGQEGSGQHRDAQASSLNDVSLLDSDRIVVSRNGSNFVLTSLSTDGSSTQINARPSAKTKKLQLQPSPQPIRRLNAECGIFKVNYGGHKKFRTVDKYTTIVRTDAAQPNPTPVKLSSVVSNVRNIKSEQPSPTPCIVAQQPVEKRQFAVIDGTNDYILPPGTIIESGALEFSDIMEFGDLNEIILPDQTAVLKAHISGGDGGGGTSNTLIVQTGEVEEEVLMDDDELAEGGGQHEIVKQSMASPAGFKIELLNSNSLDYSMNSSDAVEERPELDNSCEDVKVSTGDPQRQYACRHCGKLYRWKSTLRRHETVECGGKQPSYGCPYCHYKAKQHGNLGVHVRKHHPDQPQLASRRQQKKMNARESGN